MHKDIITQYKCENIYASSCTEFEIMNIKTSKHMHDKIKS